MEGTTQRTGIEGLDEALGGGLLPRRTYLIRGGPGTGKTTLGMHVLAATPREGPSLCVTLAEPAEQIQRDAAIRGIDVSRVHFLDLSPSAQSFERGEGLYTIFQPDEVEGNALYERLLETLRDVAPRRVLLDGVTHLRHLAPTRHQFRNQVLGLLGFLRAKGATTLLTSEASNPTSDEDLQFLADGILELDRDRHGRRTLSIAKLRGRAHLPGPHDVLLDAHGLRVFPWRPPEEADAARATDPGPQLTTGNPALDALLGGGIEAATITLITGPPGVGKTALGTQVLRSAALSGRHAVLYSFEELPGLLAHRSASLSQPLDSLLESGALHIERIEPLRHTPQQFARKVQDAVAAGARLIMLDSTAGYRLAMRGEDLTVQIHRLCKSLQNQGVGVLLVTETPNVTGDLKPTRCDISYLADNILLLRYVEVCGELRKTIGVLKKRFSDFERTLREFEVTSEGIRLGPPLSHLQGILSGTARWTRSDG